MNDTKWREVLLLAFAATIPYDIAFVGDGHYRHGLHLDPGALEPHGVSDPGLSGGGPHRYREIHTIRVARHVMSRDPVTGIRVQDSSASDRYLACLANVGMLPIELSADYIYIHGYDMRSC